MSGIEVEVCHAGPHGQFLLRVSLPGGATVGDAIDASGIRAHIPGVSIDDDHVGIFARPVKLSTPVRTGDRVEIYRPLIVDPRQARRERAAQTRGK